MKKFHVLGHSELTTVNLSTTLNTSHIPTIAEEMMIVRTHCGEVAR